MIFNNDDEQKKKKCSRIETCKNRRKVDFEEDESK